MEYYSIAAMSKTLGVSAQTLRNWDKNGKLKPHHTTSSGYRYYSQEQLSSILGIKENIDKKIIGYCRVSSNKQKDDLQRQIQNMESYLLSQGKPYEIISENQVEKIVVLYKDRLVRFGFELIEYIANLNGCDIEIVDTTKKSEQEELVEDLIQIITVFSCRLQGKRANKAKTMIKELIENDIGKES